MPLLPDFAPSRPAIASRIIRITEPDDARLADYLHLKDIALRRSLEPERGLYIAESSQVIRRALAAGHRPRSLLMSDKWLESMADVIYAVGQEEPHEPQPCGHDLDAVPGEGSVKSMPAQSNSQESCPYGEEVGREPGSKLVPVFVADEDLLTRIAGFHVHRGAIAAMHRPVLPSVADVIAGARRVAVLEDIVDHTNVGAMFRSAAALGVDAVLVTPRCADPLYRRSVRVSMGTVFQVPWTRLPAWPAAGLAELRAAGFLVAALALSDDAVPLDEFAPPHGSAPHGSAPHGSAPHGSARSFLASTPRVCSLATLGPRTRGDSGIASGQGRVDLGGTAAAAEPVGTTTKPVAGPVAAPAGRRLALILGTEGDGLSRGALAGADVVVKIPMTGEVDSLNVAAASAVAFWATRGW